MSIPNIRYYAKMGILPLANRTPSGHRYYMDNDTKRLNFVIQCRALGFLIRKITALIRAEAGCETPCSQEIKLAERRLDDVRESIAELKRVEAVLQKCLTRDPAQRANAVDIQSCAEMSVKG
ncbi:MAG: MerR family mercuric resistance operon transcriptional regulator [Lentisphaeria bacterium]|jgi:MerR family mercuric resistance operon transcriptional regulator